MLISVLTAIVVAAAADRARNETYCGRAGRGSFRCRGRGRTKTCWADETCKPSSRATPGEQLWMTRLMDYAPFAVVVERDGWRRTDPAARSHRSGTLRRFRDEYLSRLGGSGDSS